jgi:hypothetical protein
VERNGQDTVTTLLPFLVRRSIGTHKISNVLNVLLGAVPRPRSSGTATTAPKMRDLTSFQWNGPFPPYLLSNPWPLFGPCR